MQCNICSYSTNKGLYEFTIHLNTAHGIHDETAQYITELQHTLDALKAWKES
jgi:hypothetical protein